MATTAQQYVQPTTRFAMPMPMVGSMVPGDLVRYNIKATVNHRDLTNDKSLRGRRTQFPSIVKAPDMNEQHSSGNEVMKRLMAMIKGGNGMAPHEAGPQLREGFERVKDDRSWRNIQA
jgi:hypothetical protein